ncbi:MAG TPA: hypothetical protein QF630_08915, partial [Alphaproteobacteria bacterium]|nr:hypothetical protein [Alphaproteobacteria bacterium]
MATWRSAGNSTLGQAILRQRLGVGRQGIYVIGRHAQQPFDLLMRLGADMEQAARAGLEELGGESAPIVIFAAGRVIAIRAIDDLDDGELPAQIAMPQILAHC